MRIAILVALAVTLGLNAHAREGKKQSRFRTGSEVRSVPREHNIVREEGRNVVYPRRSQVDFDDSLIEGEVRNPSEFYFVHRPEEKFGTLVKRRKNFHKEMLRDTVMIR